MSLIDPPPAYRSEPTVSDADVVATAREVLREYDKDNVLVPCEMARVLIGSDLVDRIAPAVADLLAGRAAGEGRPEVALLVDGTLIQRLGVDLKQDVAQRLSQLFEVRTVVASDGHAELHASEEVIRQATEAVRGVAAIVTVGGGTISDIGKLASRDAGRLPLVSVQTAASVDGFTDNVSVILRNGVKRTVDSRWPDVVIADIETIVEAPPVMNLAGYGEINSMFTAPADWRLANLVGVDPSFHPGPIRLLDEVGQGIEQWSAGLGREPSATLRLTQALALRGIATGVSGSTACLSGAEHLISHMLDLWHGQLGVPIGLHGAQVGVGSVVAAAAWEMLFERMDAAGDDAVARLRVPSPAELEALVLQAFAAADPSGQIGAECWTDVKGKLGRLNAAHDQIVGLLSGWSVHQTELRTLVRTSGQIARGLRAAGSAARFADLQPSVGPDLVRWAVTNAPLMRNRFTVLDLLLLLGWWSPDDVQEVLDRAEGAALPEAVRHA